ncbi:hypothetical protein NKR23_g4730 [Pleurostoma richardsiae]|uniref:Inclusion body clearance protein IML2 n=1 Tax=Pleurostoma richardsiae TaxID=41990 RepID=A0AA38RJ18_9PEZI|nr:hypothetical protein NKR23_g4730 [Pleurostoma richardsiae]
MTSLRTWLRGPSAANGPASSSSSRKSSASSTPNGSTSQVADPREVEISDLQDAMDAAGLIMNDDIDGAEARLRKGSSSFHLLGLGVSTFMRSILGFEKDIMAEASARLAECENRAWADMKKAQRAAEGGTGSSSSWFGRGGGGGGSSNGHVSGHASHIYPPGSEFQLVHAEAQLMSAVVAVMHESLTEGIKGFYKLRKAFVTLDAIMAAEERLLPGHLRANGASRRPKLADDPMPGSFDEKEFEELTRTLEKTKATEDDSDLDFVDAKEGQSGTQTPAATYGGHLAKSTPRPGTPSKSSTWPVEKHATDASSITSSAGPASKADTPAHSRPPSVSHLRTVNRHSVLDDGPDTTHFTNPVDAFIHSGANMCFGVLLLLLSMVPPAFSRLLYIIGFKGDRDRGVRMLWQSTKFANINGAVAGLALLSYYNGLLALSDILPDDADVGHGGDGEIVGYPRERCAALLAKMRRQYPDSRLWRLEEARLLANCSRDLRGAVALLATNADSRMRQVAALNSFELALDSMFLQDWPRMRDAFVACVELNDWSHSMYYYIAGCAEIEMYRDAVHRLRGTGGAGAGGDGGEDLQKRERSALEAEARRAKKAAEEFLRKAPACAGRKRFMAKQMPFEVFVLRKVAKLEERARALGVDLADAAGLSPVLEMTYLWNGGRRMGPDLLESALGLASWERCTAGSKAVAGIRDGEKDEVAVKVVCEASLLRGLGRTKEAREKLEEVVAFDRTTLKGPTRDDYALPCAHYELAAVSWAEGCDRSLWPADVVNGGDLDGYRRGKVDDSQAHLEQVARWESFVLDARIGMRVQTGLDTVRWLKEKKGWA